MGIPAYAAQSDFEWVYNNKVDYSCNTVDILMGGVRVSHRFYTVVLSSVAL